MAGISKGYMLESELVRKYGQFINNKKTEIESSIIRLQRQMQSICQDWQDEQNLKFTTAFIPHIDNIRRMSDLLDSYAAYCRKAAEFIDEYNRTGKI